MRVLRVDQLMAGMVLGEELKVGYGSYVRGDVLSEYNVGVIKRSHPPDRKVWVLDLIEIYPRLFRDDKFVDTCIENTVSVLRRLLINARLNKKTFKYVNKLIKSYLYEHRALFYETMILRDTHLYTYDHSLNVTLYSTWIGLALELTDVELSDLMLGGMLHDIGKLKISSRILDKPSRLDDSEFKAIRQHPLYGSDITSNIADLDERIRRIVLEHHEKLDGSGYPNGLHGDQISYLSKIVSCCDIFDAIASKRSYHDSRPVSEVFKIMDGEASAGKIERVIVDILKRQVMLYGRNTVVELSDGRSGIVMEDCYGDRPKVFVGGEGCIDLRLRGDLSIVQVIR